MLRVLLQVLFDIIEADINPHGGRFWLLVTVRETAETLPTNNVLA